MLIYILVTLVVLLLTYWFVRNHLKYSYWSDNGVETASSALPFFGHYLQIFVKPLRWIQIDRVSNQIIDVPHTPYFKQVIFVRLL